MFLRRSEKTVPYSAETHSIRLPSHDIKFFTGFVAYISLFIISEVEMTLRWGLQNLKKYMQLLFRQFFLWNVKSLFTFRFHSDNHENTELTIHRELLDILDF
jgi:hypothetical protein